MSSARARANLALYLARIVLASWKDALARQEIAATTLAQAFAGAVCGHLADAYGWFLLEIAGVASLPPHPPRRCSDLPEVAPGKAVPGELRECQQLETNGWIGDMLAEHRQFVPDKGLQNNLAVATPALPDPGQAEQWSRRLEELFARMGDSLDEY